MAMIMGPGLRKTMLLMGVIVISATGLAGCECGGLSSSCGTREQTYGVPPQTWHQMTPEQHAKIESAYRRRHAQSYNPNGYAGYGAPDADASMRPPAEAVPSELQLRKRPPVDNAKPSIQPPPNITVPPYTQMSEPVAP